MIALDGSQIRQLSDTAQVYATYRAAEREHEQRFKGSLSWKQVGGRDYLYRKRADIWTSLGPRRADTEAIHAQFHAGRDQLRTRRKALDVRIRELAPINRAMRLGRVPWIAARVLRAMDRAGLMGSGLRVVGTHALYAYESLAGIHFESDHLATMDIDLLYDTRQNLAFTGSDLTETGVSGILATVDKTFAPTEGGSFRAANNDGFMVDLITPLRRDAALSRTKPRIGSDDNDLIAVEIEGLIWLENSPAIDQIAIDERGFPVRIVVPDPRAFAIHKSWVSQRVDRDPPKARRDAAQAEAVANMIAHYMPTYRFDDPVLGAIPAPLRDAAKQLGRSAIKPVPDTASEDPWN